MENKLDLTLSFKSREDRTKLRAMTEYLEKITDMDGLAISLEIVIAELINNAVKAKLKRLFFETKKISFEDMDSYRNGLKIFQLNYGYLNFMHYERAMAMLDLKVYMNLDLELESIVLFVQTNNTMSEFEEKYLREQLKSAMEKLPDEMLNLYLHYGDEISSNGLGLSMAVEAIYKLGFDPEHFRIYNDKNHTKTRLELPLGSKYIPQRKQYLQGQ